MEDDVIVGLNTVVVDCDTELSDLAKLCAQFRRRHWQNLSRKAATALRGIEKQILGNSFQSRLRRIVLFGTYDDLEVGRDGTYGKQHAIRVDRLAQKALRRRDELKAVLPLLLRGTSHVVSQFGYSLGKHDSRYVLWQELFDSYSQAGSERRPDLLLGYLGAMIVNDRTRWEQILLNLITRSSPQDEILPLLIGSGMTDTVLDALCAAVEQEILPARTFNGFAYLRNNSGLSYERYLSFISWCVNSGHSLLLQVALRAAYVLFHIGTDLPPIPVQPTLDLLTADGVFGDSREPYKLDHEWAALAEKLIVAHPESRQNLFENVLERLSDGLFAAHLLHSAVRNVLAEIIKAIPNDCWKILSSKLERNRSTGTDNLLMVLGPV